MSPSAYFSTQQRPRRGRRGRPWGFPATPINGMPLSPSLLPLSTITKAPRWQRDRWRNPEKLWDVHGFSWDLMGKWWCYGI